MALFDDYVTLDEMKSYLRIDEDAQGGDDVDDAELALAITTASRAINRACNRQFALAASATARIYTPEWDTVRLRWVVSIFDVMTTTGLVVKSDLDADDVYENTITDYRLIPVNAADDEKPWTDIIFGSGVSLIAREFALEITAQWGWTAVPSSIKSATLLQASRFFKRRDAPFGVTGSPEMGNQMRLLAKLDPDVDVMVQNHKRWWAAA